MSLSSSLPTSVPVPCGVEMSFHRFQECPVEIGPGIDRVVLIWGRGYPGVRGALWSLHCPLPETRGTVEPLHGTYLSPSSDRPWSVTDVPGLSGDPGTTFPRTPPSRTPPFLCRTGGLRVAPGRKNGPSEKPLGTELQMWTRPVHCPRRLVEVQH